MRNESYFHRTRYSFILLRFIIIMSYFDPQFTHTRDTKFTVLFPKVKRYARRVFTEQKKNRMDEGRTKRKN